MILCLTKHIRPAADHRAFTLMEMMIGGRLFRAFNDRCVWFL